MERLKLQLYGLRNKIIDEYDAFLKEKKETVPYMRKEPLHDKSWNVKADDELYSVVTVRKRFLSNINEIENEIKALEEQKNIIEKQLIDGKSSDDSRQRKEVTQSNAKCDNDLVKILETKNPFVPHQEIINKLSAMLYMSYNDGKTFQEIQGASFCESCNIKTLLCPHKLNCKENIICLPKGCTHLKIVRPTLICSNIRNNSKDDIDEANEPVVIQCEIANFNEKVWHWYMSRYNKKPTIPKTLTQEYLLYLLNEIYAYILANDECHPAEVPAHHFLLSLENFLLDRYSNEEIASLTLYNILNAIERYSSKSQNVLLFAHYCAANIDPSICRYLLLVDDMINNSSLLKQMISARSYGLFTNMLRKKKSRC